MSPRQATSPKGAAANLGASFNNTSRKQADILIKNKVPGHKSKSQKRTIFRLTNVKPISRVSPSLIMSFELKKRYDRAMQLEGSAEEAN